MNRILFFLVLIITAQAVEVRAQDKQLSRHRRNYVEVPSLILAINRLLPCTSANATANATYFDSNRPQKNIHDINLQSIPYLSFPIGLSREQLNRMPYTHIEDVVAATHSNAYQQRLGEPVRLGSCR